MLESLKACTTWLSEGLEGISPSSLAHGKSIVWEGLQPPLDADSNALAKDKSLVAQRVRNGVKTLYGSLVDFEKIEPKGKRDWSL